MLCGCHDSYIAVRFMNPTQEHRDAFTELCQDLGLAILLGQKVQFALAHYYAISKGNLANWSLNQRRESVSHHLGKPLGHVIAAVKKDVPLEADLTNLTETFLKKRNWLVHSFDEEATEFLVKGEKFPEYTAEMRAISDLALMVMQHLDEVRKKLIPIETKALGD
jgi:hypothetical protein